MNILYEWRLVTVTFKNECVYHNGHIAMTNWVFGPGKVQGLYKLERLTSQIIQIEWAQSLINSLSYYLFITLTVNIN